jgi:hypothetical protein
MKQLDTLREQNPEFLVTTAGVHIVTAGLQTVYIRFNSIILSAIGYYPSFP